jgi:FtsZ-binding cell division protein ZapB
MTDKDNVVDLNPKPEKITPSQLEKVQKAVSDINRVQLEIGRLETQKHMLNHETIKMQD